jgi:integrase
MQPRNKGASEPRARAMHSALSVFFGWLKSKRLITVDPSIGLQAPSAPEARDRALTDAEIGRFWTATGAVSEPFGAILKMLLLSGNRLSEVAGMRWAELSDDRVTWTISGERTKNHRPHVVPLPPMAQELMANIHHIEGSPFVFTTTGRSPVSGWSKMKTRLDVAMQPASPWRLHDLRRTAATGMADLGISPHIVEAVLNHVSGAKAGVAGTYNRAAYTAEKKAALVRWAVHIEGLVAGRPAQVVPLRKAGA